jgi:two-component system response regulator GlrR
MPLNFDEHSVHATAPGGGLAVLVVDVDPAQTKLATTVLTREGHSVSTARTGEEALRHLERQAVDVVVADLSLGTGMSGWLLARQVRQRWAGTVFVLLTACGASVDPTAGRAAGIDDVIVKPYRLTTLRQAVRKSSAKR